jgi:uncharacterized protein YraI
MTSRSDVLSRLLRRSLFVAATLVLSASALAQVAYTTRGVNMRAGPDGQYPQVAWVPSGVQVNVAGCVDGWRWCDVIAGPNRGWVYSEFLVYPYQNRRVPIITGGSILGLPLITFSLAPYWDNYYRGRSWYGNRSYWYDRPTPYYRPPPPAYRPPHYQPGYGQPGYGRPPNSGQPPQYQPGYGQPGYGRPPNGGQPPQHQPGYGQPGYGHPPNNGQPPNTGQPPHTGQPPGGRPPSGGQPPNTGQPPGGRPPGGGGRPPSSEPYNGSQQQ